MHAHSLVRFFMGDYCDFLEELTAGLTAAPPPKSLAAPAISVIIPVYNTKNYIIDCLMSVTGQTLKNIEIIIIDDGSTDKSSDIIKMFMQHDCRIKLITQNNRGAGIAKNNALKTARGKCIAFVDSDDILEYKALETAYEIYKQTASDIVIFGAYGILNNKKTHCYYNIKKVQKKFLGKKLKSDILMNDLFSLPIIAMCKIYDREFLEKNNILFQEVRKGEDQLFFIKSILLSKSVYIINENLYGYRKNRKNSLTFAKQKKDKSVIENFYAIEEFLEKGNFQSEIKIKILNRYFDKCVSWLGKCEKGYKKEYFEELKKLLAYLHDNHPELFSHHIQLSPYSKYLIIKFKLLCLLLRRKLNGSK